MLSESGTQQLIELAQRGDRAAFDCLAERFAARLRTAIRRGMGLRLRGALEADDLVQEVFLRAYRSLPAFQWTSERAFYRWLLGIARHVVLTAGEWAGRREVLELDRDIPDSGTSPSRALRREERFERLEEAMAVLSPDHREVIRQACLEGRKVKDIAARMHRSPEAVMKLLSRALEKLKTVFPPTESLHLPDRCIGEARSEDHGRR
jgi:RNA polymerase sigma-70 factor (ECF subfamily)